STQAEEARASARRTSQRTTDAAPAIVRLGRLRPRRLRHQAIAATNHRREPGAAGRTVKSKRKHKGSAARPADPGLGFVLEQQPDDVTCGPACLHGIYRHYGDNVPLSSVIADIH